VTQNTTVEREYDVCLSFAGEQRSYVEAVASELRDLGVRVFYDDYEKSSLWGKNLFDHLDYIYSRAARYCVLFVSDAYASKVWTSHERRSAQERALSENSEYVLPVIFDDTRLPGLPSTVGYLDARSTEPSEVAALLRQKLGPLTRMNYVPPWPFLLYAALHVDSDREQYMAREVAKDFVDKMRRATVEERRLVIGAFTNRCPRSAPGDPHVNLDYLRRLLGVARAEVVEMAKGLGSLGFSSRVARHGDDDVLHLRWETRSTYIEADVQEYSRKHGPAVAVHMLVASLPHLCADCQDRLAETLDFSQLQPGGP
jgi:hypothetical protein